MIVWGKKHLWDPMKIFIIIFCQLGFLWAKNPSLLPCRIKEGKNSDLFFMTIGYVETPVADGFYNPIEDEVILKDGKVIKNYFRDVLGIKYFRPMDKSKFPLPPSGWCSWYYYYQEINENEIKKNAKWIADNLKDYGAVYVQIDDGWQGKGHGSGDNRDWETIDRRFSSGMDKLAKFIKELGLKPGIWLAPHGQSNEEVVKREKNAFLLKPDGTSASETWEGKFLLDPSTKESHQYLKKLFKKLCDWGYEYFKIDGQPIVVREYRDKWKFMKNPQDPDILYRKTLESIREAIGDERYLLGCWGIPLEGIGIMNGSRTGGDVVLGWDGFKVALKATMDYYFLHNIAWYCDPDVMLLRPPLTIEQARVWATLQGLTGQALMASDRMMDLPPERVKILKKVFPALDIRPMDLFPSKKNKRIWDLKINHLDRTYDVVGLFNFKHEKREVIYVSWEELGLPNKPIHIFDFWEGEYLGAWEGGLSIEIPPTSCKVLTLLPDNGNIQLISTSRHITQGVAELLFLKSNGNYFEGRSRIIKNEPYEISFAFPKGKNYIVKSVSADKAKYEFFNYQGWSRVKFTPLENGVLSWKVSFSPSDIYDYPVTKPSEPWIEKAGIDRVLLEWNDSYYLNKGYNVYLDGKILGYTPYSSFLIKNLDPDKSYMVEIKSVWESGRESEGRTISFKLIDFIPDEIYLSDIEPVVEKSGWGNVEMDRAVSGRPISINGKRFEKGIGTHSVSEIEYDLEGIFSYFTAKVGIDDGNRSEKGSVEFIVLGDGKELWRSGIMRKSDGIKELNLKIDGIKRILLKVEDGGDGSDYDHADWAEAKLKKSKG